MKARDHERLIEKITHFLHSFLDLDRKDVETMKTPDHVPDQKGTR